MPDDCRHWVGIRIFNELGEDLEPTGGVHVLLRWYWGGTDFWVTNAPSWLIRVAR